MQKGEFKAKIHVLKTVGTVWDAVSRGEKTFEIRRNDRFFQSGDVVVLRRIQGNDESCPGTYSPGGGNSRFSTQDLTFKIGWMLQGGQFGIEPGHCVFQLSPFPEPAADV